MSKKGYEKYDEFIDGISDLYGWGYRDKLEEIGWFDDLTVKEKRWILDEVEELFTKDKSIVFLALATLEFDAECISVSGPDKHLWSYYEILREFARVSRYRFDPVDIKDEYDRDKKQVLVSFKMGDRDYQLVLEEDEWYNPKVTGLVNRALADAGVQERFIGLPVVDQYVRVVFVTPELYQKAVEAGLIPEGGEYFLGGERRIVCI
jgi:hypothetical protein